MKTAFKISIEHLSKLTLGVVDRNAQTSYTIQQSVLLFFEELCNLMISCTEYFNELIVQSKPQQCAQILQVGQPRPSLIILKGVDKMILSLEGRIIRVRTVQVHIQCDRHHQAFLFEPKLNDFGNIIWRCATDGQLVNPELIAEHYLLSFLLTGCGQTAQTLRLVANASRP